MTQNVIYGTLKLLKAMCCTPTKLMETPVLRFQSIHTAITFFQQISPLSLIENWFERKSIRISGGNTGKSTVSPKSNFFQTMYGIVSYSPVHFQVNHL